MFSLISAAHLTLMIYTIRRNFARPAAAQRAYAYVPRTSMFIVSILKSRWPNGRSASRSKQAADE